MYWGKAEGGIAGRGGLFEAIVVVEAGMRAREVEVRDNMRRPGRRFFPLVPHLVAHRPAPTPLPTLHPSPASAHTYTCHLSCRLSGTTSSPCFRTLRPPPHPSQLWDLLPQFLSSSVPTQHRPWSRLCGIAGVRSPRTRSGRSQPRIQVAARLLTRSPCSTLAKLSNANPTLRVIVVAMSAETDAAAWWKRIGYA